MHGNRHYLCVCVCHGTVGPRHPGRLCVCVAQEDYLRDGLNKTDAVVSSLDLNQAVTEVIPVVFPLAKKGCLLFLVKLGDTHTHTPIMSVHDLTLSSLMRTGQQVCQTMV